jgi:chemotaxis response regulator CheB
VIVIGGSIGGPAAIVTVLKDLSQECSEGYRRDSPCWPGREFDLSKWFRQFGHIEIRETRQGERLREGVVFVAPPGHSVTVHNGQLRLETVAHMPSPRHSIDRLFESAAKAYGDRVIGVILSGYLADGSQGLRAVAETGGLRI